MPKPEDPYLLPNGTLRNKLGITRQAKLTAAETDLAAARERRLRIHLPGLPSTFDLIRTRRMRDVNSHKGPP